MTENTPHQGPQPIGPLGTGCADGTGTTDPTRTPGSGAGTAAPAESATAAGTALRKFRRSRSNRLIAGVCGGGAELLGVDATLLRLLLIAATLLGFGAGIVLYLACWIIAPEE